MSQMLLTRPPQIAPAGTLPCAPGSPQKLGTVVRMLECAAIAPNPAQPRRSFTDESIIRLADSIRQYGVLQPLTVRRVRTPDGTPSYELIAGERRLRAAKLLGLREAPCLVIDVDERRSAELALIENLQREDLNIFEQAAAIASLIDIYHLTQEQAARQLSVSQSYIANKLRILRLTAGERELLLRASLSERHARALLKIPDEELRFQTLRTIAARGMNVAAAEEYIDRVLEQNRQERQQARRRFILKDIRILYNTVDRAVELCRKAGIDVISDRRDVGDGVELTIRIPNALRGAQRAEN